MLKTCTSLKWYGNNIIERRHKNFILKEADNKTEALPRASKTIFEVGQCMQKKISIKAN